MAERKKLLNIRIGSQRLKKIEDVMQIRGASQSDAMRYCIDSTWSQEVNPTSKASITDTAKDIMVYGKMTDEMKTVYGHSLYKKILSEGIELHDKDGKVEGKIKSLPQLLDFLQSKVFYEV